MLIQLSNIKVSPIPNKAIEGFNGTSYKLRVNSIYNKSHFRWWEEGPENWSELTSSIVKLLEYFRNVEKAN